MSPRGREIRRALRGRLSGLAQPTYMLDIPGGAAKVPIGPDWLDGGGMRDLAGSLHPCSMDSFAGPEREE